jgi:hypothetical protein
MKQKAGMFLVIWIVLFSAGVQAAEPQPEKPALSQAEEEAVTEKKPPEKTPGSIAAVYSGKIEISNPPQSIEKTGPRAGAVPRPCLVFAATGYTALTAAWKTPAALNFAAWRSGRTLLSPDAPKLFRNLPPGLARILPLPRPEASRYDKGQRGSHSLSP